MLPYFVVLWMRSSSDASWLTSTLAALRAHKTRTEVALRKAKTARDKNELAAKVADYERRIARVMAAAGVAIEDKSHQAA